MASALNYMLHATITNSVLHHQVNYLLEIREFEYKYSITPIQ